MFLNFISRQIRQVKENGCLRKGSSRRPHVSEEQVKKINDAFEGSSRDSTRLASRQFGFLNNMGRCHIGISGFKLI